MVKTEDMDANQDTLPRIPDDWNRETTRGNTKNSNSKQSQVNLKDGGDSSNKSMPKTTSSTNARKRKRNASSSSVACASTAIGTKPQASQSTITSCIKEKMPMSMGSEPTSGSSIDTTKPQGTQITENDTSPQISASSQRHCEETESVMCGLYHQVEKLSRRPGCALKEGIYLDSIMTHIPYTDVLEQMFGGNAATDSACVPAVTLAYEEGYMREIMGVNEENCIMGSNCKCQFVDEHSPFTGVQFTLPVEAFSSSSATVGMMEELSSKKICVFCCRKNTKSLF